MTTPSIGHDPRRDGRDCTNSPVYADLRATARRAPLVTSGPRSAARLLAEIVTRPSAQAYAEARPSVAEMYAERMR